MSFQFETLLGQLCTGKTLKGARLCRAPKSCALILPRSTILLHNFKAHDLGAQHENRAPYRAPYRAPQPVIVRPIVRLKAALKSA